MVPDETSHPDTRIALAFFGDRRNPQRIPRFFRFDAGMVAGDRAGVGVVAGDGDVEVSGVKRGQRSKQQGGGENVIECLQDHAPFRATSR